MTGRLVENKIHQKLRHTLGAYYTLMGRPDKSAALEHDTLKALEDPAGLQAKGRLVASFDGLRNFKRCARVLSTPIHPNGVELGFVGFEAASLTTNAKARTALVASGLVVGTLNADGTPDAAMMRAFVEDADAGGLGMLGAEGRMEEELSTGEQDNAILTTTTTM